MKQIPVLYSFRRCPFAIRARIAIYLSGRNVELREILLRDKPAEMLKISPKGTVPILLLPNGNILDESIDIMYWALSQNDPLKLLQLTQKQKSIGTEILNHIPNLNINIRRYKGIAQDKNISTEQVEALLFNFLLKYNNLLITNSYLVDNEIKIFDFALFPFIRQIISHNRNLFDKYDFNHLLNWHDHIISSTTFESAMHKYKVWTKQAEPVYFPGIINNQE